MSMELIGHEHQRHALSQLLSSGRIPSTMMFCGPSGIGKFMVAQELTASLLCQRGVYGGCGACKHCHLLFAGNHPDLHIISCLDKESTGVSAVRETLYSLALSPYEAGCRVVIFNDAEHLSIQSANALLKSLEEPRPNTFYVLVTASPSKLPATVVSRSQVWFFSSLNTAEIAAILSRRQSSGQELPAGVSAAQLARMADGSMDTIDAVAQHIDEWRSICESLDDIIAGQSSRAISLANDLTKHKQHVRIYLQLLRIRARECMRLPAARPALSKWGVFLSNVIVAERLIFERNLSPALVLANAILSLCRDNQRVSSYEMAGHEGLIEHLVVS